jgi:hypothetical protein
MDFEERLKEAIQRGHRRSDKQRIEAEAQAISEEELKRLHGQFRLRLSEHIEDCIRRLPSFFPGFQYETIYGERGWGGACSRDDLRVRTRGQRSHDYSRLEMTVRPLSSLYVLELGAKGTIRNKEVFNRNFYEKIHDVDESKFAELVDVWVLEYAELYAARVR